MQLENYDRKIQCAQFKRAYTCTRVCAFTFNGTSKLKSLKNIWMEIIQNSFVYSFARWNEHSWGHSTVRASVCDSQQKKYAQKTSRIKRNFLFLFLSPLVEIHWKNEWMDEWVSILKVRLTHHFHCVCVVCVCRAINDFAINVCPIPCVSESLKWVENANFSIMTSSFGVGIVVAHMWERASDECACKHVCLYWSRLCMCSDWLNAALWCAMLC